MRTDEQPPLIEPDLRQAITCEEAAFLRAAFCQFDLINDDSEVFLDDEFQILNEPVTPAIILCYLRNDEIVNEWGCVLINHCRFYLESLPEDVQHLARDCYYSWERSHRAKVNWIDEGF